MSSKIFTDNQELIDLLFQDNPPSVEQVIEVEKSIWASGRTPNSNLFKHLIKLAVLSEKTLTKKID